LGTYLPDPTGNSTLFSTRPSLSSSESLQKIGAAHFFQVVSVNMTQFVIQKTYMPSRKETNSLRVQTIHRKWELPISL
jgi:hypothetical protein